MMNSLLLLLASNLAGAQSMTTNGTRSAQVTGLPATGASYTIANDYGDVEVACGSGSTAKAEVVWTLSGAPIANKSVTDQIQPKASLSKDKATLKVEAPADLPGDAKLTLKVTMPAAGKITLTGKAGLTVAECGGTLTANSIKGDVSINGTFNQLAVTAADGNLTTTLGKETLAAASSLSAPKGNITVSMPYLNSNVTATAGDSITVSMPYISQPTDTKSLTSNVGSGGAAFVINAGKTLLFK